MVLLCFLGLTLECLQLVIDFKDQVFDASEVLFGCLEFIARFFFACFVNRNAGCLLQHFTPAIVFVLDQVVDHVQRDDRVAVGTDPGIHEQVLDILQTTLHVIQSVFAFPTLIEFAGNGYRAEFSGQQIPGIFKRQAHFRQSARTAGLGTIENKTIEILATKLADLLLTDHPTNAVDNVGFSTTIWTDDPGHIFIKMNNGLVGKTFEPLDL